MLKKLRTPLIYLAILAVVVLLIKLVGGAVTVASAGFNAVLGVVLVLALVMIVVWMFLYARKK